MNVTKSSVPGHNLRNGMTIVGQTVTQLVPDGLAPCAHGVWIKALGSFDANGCGNGANVFIGSVDVETSGPNMGWPLEPDEEMFIPTADPSLVFVISTQDDQRVLWLAL
jgi:hypothetical protein